MRSSSGRVTNAYLVLLATAGLVAGGCSSKAALRYQPGGVVAGEGSVRIGAFTYEPALTGKVQPNQSQIWGATLKGESFNENIDTFMAGALTAEMEHSGFDVRLTAGPEITGVIEAFGIDHSPKLKRWEAVVAVRFLVHQDSAEVFAYAASERKEYRSVMGGAKPRDVLATVTRDCFAQFLSASRTAGVFERLPGTPEGDSTGAPEVKDDIY